MCVSERREQERGQREQENERGRKDRERVRGQKEGMRTREAERECVHLREIEIVCVCVCMPLTCSLGSLLAPGPP